MKTFEYKHNNRSIPKLLDDIKNLQQVVDPSYFKNREGSLFLDSDLANELLSWDDSTFYGIPDESFIIKDKLSFNVTETTLEITHHVNETWYYFRPSDIKRTDKWKVRYHDEDSFTIVYAIDDIINSK